MHNARKCKALPLTRTFLLELFWIDSSMPVSRLTPITLGLSALLSAGFACATTILPQTSISTEVDEDDPRVKETHTATRTATSVRYVPQAIDSVKTETLRAYGTNDLGQALSGIPNVSSGADTRFDSLRIRGFDASNDFYLDGIRDDSQYVRDLHNIERIEVLKGPAAVLYGRGSQGGIVNRISKAPQFGRRSSIEVQGGSQDLRSLYADLSTDPTENISLRLNMGNQDNNSFRDGVSGNRHRTCTGWCSTNTAATTAHRIAAFRESMGVRQTWGAAPPMAAAMTSSMTSRSPCVQSSATNSMTTGSCATPWGCSSSTAISTTPT